MARIPLVAEARRQAKVADQTERAEVKEARAARAQAHKASQGLAYKRLRQQLGQPVAFLHMDVDLYSSAREVMLHFACRFVPGTVISFDELINYQDWQNTGVRGGEFSALNEVAALVGFTWAPLDIYHEQAVPIVILDNKRLTCED